MDTPVSTALTQTTGDTGFSLANLLLFVGGAILLAFFCSIGLIARMREHKIEQRREAAAKAARAMPETGKSLHAPDVADQLADPVGHQHGDRAADDDA